MIRFPPPLCLRNVILLRGNGHRPEKKIPLSEASKTGFGGGALWYVSPPKIARYVLPPLFANSQKRSTCVLKEAPFHPDAKGVRQKEFGKKVTKKVTEASEKVTEKWPKASRKRKKVIELLLLHSFCGTLTFKERLFRSSSPVVKRLGSPQLWALALELVLSGVSEGRQQPLKAPFFGQLRYRWTSAHRNHAISAIRQ